MNKSWPVDNHVHTRWSLDIPNGPIFEDYVPFVEREKIHVNFLDHLQIALFHEDIPLRAETIENYLESFDVARSKCPHLSVGFEVDYYPDKEQEIAEFLDSYKRDVDLIVGTVHELAPQQPITVALHLKNLLKHHSFEELVAEYFDREQKMVESGLFGAIAHPDVIFRYCGDVVDNRPEYSIHPRLLELGRLCKQKGVRMELNVRGLVFPCKRPFPCIEAAQGFLKSGIEMFVGSDSHSVADVEAQAAWVRQANAFVRGEIEVPTWQMV